MPRFSTADNDKKTTRLYRILYRLVWQLSPKYRIEGADRLPDGACVIVGNHCHMYGPIAGEMYTPGKHSVWCAGEMMHRQEVADYAYRDFWSGKPRAIRWFFRLLSHLIVPLAVLIFNSAHTIPVYHDNRLLTTFRESTVRLQAGERIVIFPECYDAHNNIVHGFQNRFVDLGRLYYKKTGQPLPFVPMYLAPRLKTIYYGEPILFDPDVPMEEARTRICGALMDAITAMAVSLPEHTVIPYPNIPKKQYPKNVPLEVYGHEKTTL